MYFFYVFFQLAKSLNEEYEHEDEVEANVCRIRSQIEDINSKYTTRLAERLRALKEDAAKKVRHRGLSLRPDNSVSPYKRGLSSLL